MAKRLYQQSLALLEEIEAQGRDVRAEQASVLRHMADQRIEPDPEKARRLLEQSLALSRTLNDQWGMANALVGLAHPAEILGDYGKARKLLQECLVIRQTLGDQRGIANVLNWLGLVAMYQGQLEEGERLFRESITLYQTTGAQVQIVQALRDLGINMYVLGRFVECIPLQEEILAICDDLGLGLSHYNSVAMTHLGLNKAMLGRYEQAHTHAKQGHSLAKETGDWSTLGIACAALGMVAQARRAYVDAGHWFQEGITAVQLTKQQTFQLILLAGSGFAVCGLGDLHQAGQRFRQVLQLSIKSGAFLPLQIAIPGIALLLAEQGKRERAVELYALASCDPFVSNSQWFEDVAGQHIAAIAATLSPDAVAAAQERGKTRDLWATAAELLAELGGGTQD